MSAELDQAARVLQAISSGSSPSLTAEMRAAELLIALSSARAMESIADSLAVLARSQ